MLEKLPDKWLVISCEEAKKYLSEKYGESEILNWRWTYIGFTKAANYSGCLGTNTVGRYGEVLISFEDFKRLVLNVENNNEPKIEIW